MPAFSIASASHRANTEDRAIVLPIETGWIVGVADGTGGMSGGAKAAEMFIAGLHRAASPSFAVTDPAAWTTLLETLDVEIANDPTAGETTGIALAVSPSGIIVGASCGDSRAYLSTATGWRELTIGQARKPRLGTGRAKAQAFRADADADAVLVVGTDGLFDYMGLEEVLGAVPRTAEGGADALVRVVRERHRTLPDDVAVVVGWFSG